MVHVLIEREIARGMVTTYEALLREALQQTYVAEGFISGETFSDILDEHHRFVLCKWRSIQDWNRWLHGDGRGQFMAKVRPILNSDEKISVLEQ
jgi:quinol monooxygenase YgiN